MNEERSEGWKEICWQADNVMNGVFFFRLETEPYASSTTSAQQ
jgi:hypothetical protein